MKISANGSFVTLTEEDNNDVAALKSIGSKMAGFVGSQQLESGRFQLLLATRRLVQLSCDMPINWEPLELELAIEKRKLNP